MQFFDPLANFPGNNEGANSSTRDIFLFRLADTYLLIGEAYFKLGQLDKAAEKINVVRKRTAVAGQGPDIMPSDVTLDFILDERARELDGEYHRWLDLERTRKLGRAFEHNILTNCNT